MARSKKLEVEECGEREVRDGEIIREVDGMGVGVVTEGNTGKGGFGLICRRRETGVSNGLGLELFDELLDNNMGDGEDDAFTEYIGRRVGVVLEI